MRCGNGDTEYAGKQQAECRGKICGKALVFFKLYHIHTDGLDDLFTADTRAERHDDTAKDHEPDRDGDARDTCHAVRECKAEKENADEFLTVLRAMHKAHRGGTEDLCAVEEAVRTASVGISEDKRYDLTDRKARDKTEEKAQDQSEKDFFPFFHVDTADAVLDGDGGTCKTCDQAVALTGRNTEIGCADAIDHDGKERGTKRDHGAFGIAAEVDHVADGACDRGVDPRHDENTEKIKKCAHEDRTAHTHASCRNAGRDGIGGICPAVDKDNAER